MEDVVQEQQTTGDDRRDEDVDVVELGQAATAADIPPAPEQDGAQPAAA